MEMVSPKLSVRSTSSKKKYQSPSARRRVCVEKKEEVRVIKKSPVMREVAVTETSVVTKSTGHGLRNSCMALLFFVLVFFAAWALLYVWRPTLIINEEEDSIDWIKTIFCAAVLALIVLIFVGIIWCACRGGASW